jgi:hypothetical protein
LATRKRERNVGREIRDGLRELKRGDHGRVIEVPDAADRNPRSLLVVARRFES